jgi:hypothetical protein
MRLHMHTPDVVKRPLVLELARVLHFHVLFQRARTSGCCSCCGSGGSCWSTACCRCCHHSERRQQPSAVERLLHLLSLMTVQLLLRLHLQLWLWLLQFLRTPLLRLWQYSDGCCDVLWPM